MAATALSMLPCPVSRMTLTKGSSCCSDLRSARPSSFGMTRSETTTEGKKTVAF